MLSPCLILLQEKTLERGLEISRIRIATWKFSWWIPGRNICVNMRARPARIEQWRRRLKGMFEESRLCAILWPRRSRFVLPWQTVAMLMAWV